MQYINVPPEALKLPDTYVPPIKLEKRMALAPDFSTFNEGQKTALQIAMDYVLGKMPQYRSICIEGYAGTGKTYWENQFIQWLLTVQKKTVRATAPTNKAVNVIEDNADYHHPNLKHMTIHKLLGLKEVYNEQTNKMEFAKDYDAESEIDTIDTLIIDEGSMFPDDLFDMIYDYVMREEIKLIFLGDSFQIPPIGKEDCIPFTGKGRLKYQIGIVRLTEIVRQASDSPIINYSIALREGRREEFLTNCNDHLTQLVNGSGIIDIPKSAKEEIYGICDLYFNSSMFEMNTDFFKVVAWQNKVVDAVNKKVRSLIYKTDQLTKIMVGEKLIANKPIIEPGYMPRILYSNNQEFEVVEFEITEDEVYRTPVKDGEDIVLICKYYDVKTLDKRTGKVKMIQVVHETDAFKVDALINKLVASAVALKKKGNMQIANFLFKQKFAVERRFAQISYNYAITAHKAQGSTYDHCMVIDWDILQNFKRREASRILYTAITRPKKYLFLVREDKVN